MWGGLIHGTETTAANAHVKLIYDPINQPAGIAAMATRYGCDGNQHIRINSGDATIEFYKNTATYNDSDKIKVSAHEFGHMWSIDDLYSYNNTLQSIYSQPYSFSTATRHDRNAMRIVLNNLWYEPVKEEAWYYQPSPGVWYQRGDINNDGTITSADARLVLRFSSQLEELTDLQQLLADVNGDGNVTAADSRLILNYASKLITKFPADN